MLKVAQKSAHNPLRKSGAPTTAIQWRDGPGAFSIPGINSRDFLSFQFLTLLFVAFFLVKVVLFSAFGAEAYAERIVMFMNGNAIEQIAARALDIDPITAALSKMFSVFM
ncbi:MAG: hypothetical protein P8L32_04085 [Paracoccaceae bacterium]|jgi:hypothetical protein|nr:hypothetical protein [Paracoccaceae bacterium]